MPTLTKHRRKILTFIGDGRTADGAYWLASCRRLAKLGWANEVAPRRFELTEAGKRMIDGTRRELFAGKENK